MEKMKSEKNKEKSTPWNPNGYQVVPLEEVVKEKYLRPSE